jgi:hypothetical protein
VERGPQPPAFPALPFHFQYFHHFHLGQEDCRLQPVNIALAWLGFLILGAYTPKSEDRLQITEYYLKLKQSFRKKAML